MPVRNATRALRIRKLRGYTRKRSNGGTREPGISAKSTFSKRSKRRARSFPSTSSVSRTPAALYRNAMRRCASVVDPVHRVASRELLFRRQAPRLWLQQKPPSLPPRAEIEQIHQGPGALVEGLIADPPQAPVV